MKIGDLVTRKSYQNDITFCIIDFKADENGECVAVLKALYSNTFIVDAPMEDLINLLPKGKL
ncbi:MAG: sporulation peptidase YabG [Bacillota bacterium]